MWRKNPVAMNINNINFLKNMTNVDTVNLNSLFDMKQQFE